MAALDVAVREAGLLLDPTGRSSCAPESQFSDRETAVLVDGLTSKKPVHAALGAPASMSRAEQLRLHRECPLLVASAVQSREPGSSTPSANPSSRQLEVQLVASQTVVSVVVGRGVALGSCTYLQELTVCFDDPPLRRGSLDVGCGCSITASSPRISSAAVRAPHRDLSESCRDRSGCESLCVTLSLESSWGNGCARFGPHASPDDHRSCGPAPAPTAAMPLPTAETSGAAAAVPAHPVLGPIIRGESVRWAALTACDLTLLPPTSGASSKGGAAGGAAVAAYWQRRGGVGSSEADDPVRLDLRLPAGSAAASAAAAAGAGGRPGSFLRVRLRRSYSFNLLPDGHLLVLGVPLPPPPLRLAPAAVGPAAIVQVALLDEDCSSAAVGASASGSGGGFRRVTCPSHCVAAALEAPGARGFATRVVVSAYAPLPSTGSGTQLSQLSQPSQPPRELLCLFEAANLVCPWEGLRGAQSVSLAGWKGRVLPLPPGLARLLAGEEHHAPIQPSGMVLLPAQQPPPPLLLLEPRALPAHIAVVMDGNGRWATQRGLPRTAGHVAGVDAIHRLIRACRRLRVPFLTLYAFSSQNWARPAAEVAVLMRLLADFLATDCEELCANGVRLLVSGDTARLPTGARADLQRLCAVSATRPAELTLCLALSYGGREEIAAAAAGAAAAVAAGRLPASALADPAVFRRFLPHAGILPDPDLLLRTSGELRVSNFLLWQIAYSELYVTSVLWPDFDGAALADALASYAARQRRFGLTGEQAQAACSGKGSSEQAAAVAPAAAAAAAALPISSSGGGASGYSTSSSSSSLYAGYSPEYVAALIASSSAAEGGAGPANTSSPQQQSDWRQTRFGDVAAMCRAWVAATAAWLIGLVLHLLPLQWARNAASATNPLTPGRRCGCPSLWTAQSRSRLGGRKRGKKPSRCRMVLPVVSALAFLVASVAAAYAFRPALQHIQTRVVELWPAGSSQETVQAAFVFANEAPELISDRTVKGCFATSQSQAPSVAAGPAYSTSPDSPVVSPPLPPDAGGDASDDLPLHIPLWCVSSPAEMAELGQAAAGWAHSAGSTCAASPPPSASTGQARDGGASGSGLGLRSSPVVTPFVSATASQQSMKSTPAVIEKRRRLAAVDATADPLNFAVAASDANRTRRQARIAAQSANGPWHHSHSEAVAS